MNAAPVRLAASLLQLIVCCKLFASSAAHARDVLRVCTPQQTADGATAPVRARIVSAAFRDAATVDVTGRVPLAPLSAVVQMNIDVASGASVITGLRGPAEMPPDCPNCRAQTVSSSPNGVWTLLNVLRGEANAGYEVWLRGRGVKPRQFTRWPAKSPAQRVPR